MGKWLLIAPEGIEIIFDTKASAESCNALLIAPEGIEMSLFHILIFV